MSPCHRGVAQGKKREGDDGTLARLKPPQCGERAVHPSNEVGCLPGEVEPASLQEVLEGKDDTCSIQEVEGVPLVLMAKPA